MPEFAYDVLHPDKLRSCVVFASPHSGRNYTSGFLNASVLDRHAIRSSEDAFVDRLFEGAPAFGAPFLKAGAPRAFVDLNRAAEELDPALVDVTKKAILKKCLVSCKFWLCMFLALFHLHSISLMKAFR